MAPTPLQSRLPDIAALERRLRLARRTPRLDRGEQLSHRPLRDTGRGRRQPRGR